MPAQLAEVAGGLSVILAHGLNIVEPNKENPGAAALGPRILPVR